MISKKELHENYIMILEFYNPYSEDIKQWVRDDEDSIGGFHTEWDWIMPVIEYMESLVNKGDVKIEFFITPTRVTATIDDNIVRTIECERDGKLLTIYLVMVDVIKVYNEMAEKS